MMMNFPCRLNPPRCPTPAKLSYAPLGVVVVVVVGVLEVVLVGVSSDVALSPTPGCCSHHQPRPRQWNQENPGPHSQPCRFLCRRLFRAPPPNLFLPSPQSPPFLHRRLSRTVSPLLGHARPPCPLLVRVLLLLYSLGRLLGTLDPLGFPPRPSPPLCRLRLLPPLHYRRHRRRLRCCRIVFPPLVEGANLGAVAGHRRRTVTARRRWIEYPPNELRGWACKSRRVCHTIGVCSALDTIHDKRSFFFLSWRCRPNIYGSTAEGHDLDLAMKQAAFVAFV